MTLPSKKWSEVAKFLFDDINGRHCHWCLYAKYTEVGIVNCGCKKARNYGSCRIGGWDGDWNAKNCESFKLSSFYTKDSNFSKFFDKGRRFK